MKAVELKKKEYMKPLKLLWHQMKEGMWLSCDIVKSFSGGRRFSCVASKNEIGCKSAEDSQPWVLSHPCFKGNILDLSLEMSDEGVRCRYDKVHDKKGIKNWIF